MRVGRLLLDEDVHEARAKNPRIECGARGLFDFSKSW